jgi:site-specific DNA recombinase
MSKTAILYARVSTPKQVEEGYSLDQQIECLRQYAAEHELEVLEEIRDAGYSGATLDRPGMDRIFAVVAGGGVDIVLAQDADRITREPWHFGCLKAEFERYGTKLRALDDGDDETPEGEFFAGIRRGMSKMEREYTKRRTRRGKEKKIRSGKLLGSGPPPYGFRWVQDSKGKRVGLEVDPEAMPVVHRLFELVGAHGLPMYTAAKELERQGFYAPKGACGAWV